MGMEMWGKQERRPPKSEMIAISIQHAIQRARQSLRRFTRRFQTRPSTCRPIASNAMHAASVQNYRAPRPPPLFCPDRRSVIYDCHGHLYSRCWSSDMLYRSSPYHMSLRAIHTSGGASSSPTRSHPSSTSSPSDVGFLNRVLLYGAASSRASLQNLLFASTSSQSSWLWTASSSWCPTCPVRLRASPP